MGRPWHSNQYFYREGRFCMFGASRDFSGLTTQPLPQRKQFDSSPNCCYCRPGLRKRSRPTRILRCTAAKARVGWQQVYGVTQHQLLGHHPEAAGLSLWKPWRTGMGCFYIWYISRSSINLGVDFSRCMWLCDTQCQDCNIFFLATFSVRSLISAAGVKNYVITHRFLEHISVLKQWRHCDKELSVEKLWIVVNGFGIVSTGSTWDLW